MDQDQRLHRLRRLHEQDREVCEKLDGVDFEEYGASYAAMLIRRRKQIRAEMERLAREQAATLSK
jgi:hypothetical protein